TLTDNKRWHKGGVGRLGKSPKYAQMGHYPPARHGPPLCSRRSAVGPGVAVCSPRVGGAVPVQSGWGAWPPWSAERAETGRRSHVRGGGEGTRSAPARGAPTPCTATPSR